MPTPKQPAATTTAVTQKPTTAAQGAMKVAPKKAVMPECKLITRLNEKDGEETLRAVILQLTGGDKMFVEKFAECCKMQVNRHWKYENGVWTNPFLVIPLNSQLEALYKCASRKVLPDGYNANLVPYLGKEKKVEVVIDYKGLIDCAIREGIILDADAKEVCENDDFVWNLGTVERWTFDFRKSRGRVCGYCGWIVLPDGKKKWHYMDTAEIAQVRACARADNIWRNWEGEMSKKTVIRRMFKTLRNTPTLTAMMEVDNDSFDLDNAEPKPHETPHKQVYGDPNKRRAALPPPSGAEDPTKTRNVSHGDPLADEPEVGVEVADGEHPNGDGEPEPEMVPAKKVVQGDDLFS